MLVLSRKKCEEIIIGDKVVVTVVDIRGGKVRLGIEAPKEVPVHRGEIAEQLRREGRIFLTDKQPNHSVAKPLATRTT